MKKKKSAAEGVELGGFSQKSKLKRKKNKKLIFINVIASFVLLLSCLALTGMVALNLNLFVDSAKGTQEEEGHTTASQDMQSVQKSEDEDVTYLLVCGTDESSALTDIMMVVCFDHGRGNANILQIPRDTYIGSDVNTGKINAVYGSAKKGQSRINTLIRRINTHLGLPIDHYITVSLSAFRNIVDAVGGVDLYLPERLRVADSEPPHNTVHYIGPGMTHLNGKLAEGFIRCRSGKTYQKGDMSRVEAQRNFYAAFAKKVMNMSTGQMTKIATSCYDKVKTDLSIGQLLGYAAEVQKLELNDITIYAVPGQSGNYKPAGLSVSRSYYSIHKSDYVELVNRAFMPYGEPVQESDLKITELHTRKEGSYIEPEKNLGELAR